MIVLLTLVLIKVDVEARLFYWLDVAMKQARYLIAYRWFLPVLSVPVIILSLGLYVRLVRNQPLGVLGFLFVSAICIVTLSEGLLATASNRYVWILLLPLLCYLTLGKRQGFWLTFVSGFLGAILSSYRLYYTDETVVIENVLHVSGCWLLIWFFSHTYEGGRVTSQRALARLAEKDSLTGLKNRLHMADIFDREVAAAKQKKRDLSLLLCDLDYFKKVNDDYGHNVGDQLLVSVARLLCTHIRESDYAFRVGGEEFCVLLPGAGKLRAIAIANQIRRSIERETFLCSGHPLRMTISIGVAQWGVDSDDMQQVYQVADGRLYQAKKTSRNRVVAGEPHEMPASFGEKQAASL